MLKFAKGSSQSKSPVRTPDSIVSTDTVEVLIGISEGPIKGLVDGAKTFRADDTPLENASGEANFQNFELDLWPGNENGHVVTLDLGGFSSPLNIGVPLAQNTPVVRTGVVPGIDAVDFRILIQQLLEQKDNGIFKADLSLKFEIKRTTDATWQPAWVAETGNIPDTGTPGGGGSGGGSGGGTGGGGGQGGVGIIQFQSEAIDHGDRETWASYGRANDVLTFVGDTQAVAVEGVPTAPPVDPSLPALAINTQTDDVYRWSSGGGGSWSPVPATPSGDYQTLDDGRRFYRGSDAPVGARPGDLWLAVLLVRVWNGASWVKPSEYQTRNPITSVSGVWTVYDKVSSPTPKDFRIFLPNAGETDVWEYRVTQLTPDTNTGTGLVSEILWESVQEIRRTPMAFEGVAMARVLGRASDQFTSFPNWNGDYYGRIVKVPSNYNPATRTYTGIWDGTYRIDWTDNTAFIFQDFVENTTYGLSSLFPHVVNKWKIYEWAQHCDTMVLRPDGSLRPRWTYNDYIQEPRDAREMAEYIAGTAGAKYIDDGNGIVDVVIDKDDPAVMLFTRENVGEDGFSYTYTDRLTRANEITVEFVNPNLNWQKDKRIVRDGDDIALYGRIPENFIAVGCIDVDEATARARRRLVSGLTEKEFVGFSTNRKGKFLSEWDVILVGDYEMGRGLTGRIRAVTGARSVSLRDPVTFEPGIEYWASFDLVNPAYPQYSTDRYVVERRKITNPAGTPQTSLTFETDLPDLPEYATYILEAPDVAGFPKPYRVTSLGDDSGTGEHITVQGLELNRNKWDYIDTGTEQDEIIYSTFAAGEVLPATNPTLNVINRKKGLSSVRILQLNWNRSASQWVRRYKVYHSINEVPTGVYEPNTPGLEIDGTVGAHTFTIVAIDIRGRESRPLSLTFNVDGEVRPLPSVTGLRLVGATTAGGTTFDDTSPKVAWDAIEDEPNFTSYVVEVVNPASGEILRTSNVAQALEWRYDLADHLSDTGNSPLREIALLVSAVNQDGVPGEPAALTISNPAPVAPILSVVETMAGIVVTMSPYRDRDVIGAIVEYTDAEGTHQIRGNQSSFTVPLNDFNPVTFSAAFYDAWSDTAADLNWTAPQVVSKSPIYAGDLDTTPPAKPTGLSWSPQVTQSADGSTVINMVADWNDNSEPDLAGYDTFLYEGGVLRESRRVTVSRDTFPIKSGTPYYYEVTAVDRLGNRSDLIAISTGGVAADTTPPGPVTGAVVEPYLRGISLKWTNPTDADFDGVRIYRATNGGFTDGALIAEGSGTSYNDQSVTTGQIYYYWAASVDRTGNASPIEFLGSAVARYINVGSGDIANTDPVLVTGYGVALAVDGQTDWATYGGRSTSSLTTMMTTDGYLASGLDANFQRQDMLQGAEGISLSKNPEFSTSLPLSDIGVYDNLTSGRVQIAFSTSSDTPNSTKRRMEISYDPARNPGTPTVPGYGGYLQVMSDAGTVSRGKGFYRRGSKLLRKVTAAIPAGRSLVPHTNALGDGGGIHALTSMAGTGGWVDYVLVYTIGATGSFGNTGHFAVQDGADTAFTWYVAKDEFIDITGASERMLYGLLDANGTPRTDPHLITEQGISLGFNGQGYLATENYADWTTRVVGAGKPSDNAGTTLTIVPYNADGVVRGNTFTRQNSYGWTAGGGFVSKERYAGACIVSMRIPLGYIPDVMLGLSSDNSPNWPGTAYAGIQHALYSRVGTYQIYESGSQVFTSGVTAASGDLVQVAYDGNRVQYLVNGQVIWTTNTVAGRSMFMQGVIHPDGYTITDLKIEKGSDVTTAGLNLYSPDGGVQYVFTGNSAKKSPLGTYNWNSTAYSRESFTGACAFRCKMPGAGTFAGISDNPVAGDYFNIDYAYHKDGAYLYTWVVGRGYYTVGAVTSYGPNVDYQIIYSGARITFWVDGVAVDEVVTSPGRKFYAAVNCVGAGESTPPLDGPGFVSGIQFTSGKADAIAGNNIMRGDTYAVMPQNELRTPEGISLSFNGQGALSTQNAANWNGQISNRPPVTQGESLTEDPNMVDASAWSAYSVTFNNVINDGAIGRTVARSTTGVGGTQFTGARIINVDHNKTYMIEGWFRKQAGCDGRVYGLVGLTDGDGGEIGGDGTYWLYAPAGEDLPGENWAYRQYLFGKGTDRPLPSNAKTMRVGALLNYGGSVGYMECQGLRIIEAKPPKTPVLAWNKRMLSVNGGVIRKTGTANGWDLNGLFFSKERYLRGCSVSGRLSIGPNFIGMSDDDRGPGTSGIAYDNIRYAFNTGADGNAYIYESGSYIAFASSYNEQTVFQITYDGLNVRYYVNSTLVRMIYAGQNRSFYGHCLLHDVGLTGKSEVYDFNVSGSAAVAAINGIWTTGGTAQYGQSQLVTVEGVANSIVGQQPAATTPTPSYASNAAAIAGGLADGTVFLNTSTNRLEGVRRQSGGTVGTLNQQRTISAGVTLPQNDSFFEVGYVDATSVPSGATLDIAIAYNAAGTTGAPSLSSTGVFRIFESVGGGTEVLVFEGDLSAGSGDLDQGGGQYALFADAYSRIRYAAATKSGSVRYRLYARGNFGNSAGLGGALVATVRVHNPA